MLFDEPLQFRAFGVVVVVDVHSGVALMPLIQVVDEVTGCGGLCRRIVGPPGLIPPPAQPLLPKEAEQEKQSPRWRPERMALEIEEHVTLVRFGEGDQPGGICLVRLQDHERRNLVGMTAGLDLQPRLLGQDGEPCISHVRNRTPGCGS